MTETKKLKTKPIVVHTVPISPKLLSFIKPHKATPNHDKPVTVIKPKEAAR